MNAVPKIQTATILSYSLSLVITAASLGGLLLPDTYAKETPSWMAQGVGQDYLNLFLLAPLLFLSTFLARKGSRAFQFVLAGALVYSVYTYVIYTLAVHFNRLFLVYCAGLGLSVYALGFLLAAMRREEVQSWFKVRKRLVPFAFYLFLQAGFFLMVWLSEDLPAVLSGTAPKSLEEGGFFTNPVHVLDLSLLIPASMASALALWKRKPLGYLFFPIFLAALVLFAVTIIVLELFLQSRGVHGTSSIPIIFAGVALMNGTVLSLFLRGIK